MTEPSADTTTRAHPRTAHSARAFAAGTRTSTTSSTRARTTAITARTAGRVRTLALAMTSMSPSLTT
uniref:Uncharacterized protein n=1 Tax=uncultured marine virus TaxID=186617 RepID=A0A0F7LAN3_9VIRU|nr:hypothetical protein [uncultured marine virus]